MRCMYVTVWTLRLRLRLQKLLEDSGHIKADSASCRLDPFFPRQVDQGVVSFQQGLENMNAIFRKRNNSRPTLY